MFRLLENEFVKICDHGMIWPSPSMQIEKPENFMKASIFFLLFSMGVLKPMPLADQVAGFFEVLYLISEECKMRPAWACPQST